MSNVLPDTIKYVGAQYVSSLMEAIEHLDNLLNKNRSDIDVKNSFALNNLEHLLVLAHYGLGNAGERNVSGGEFNPDYIESLAHGDFVVNALRKSQVLLDKRQIRDYLKIEYQTLQGLNNLQNISKQDRPIYQDLKNFLSTLLPYAQQDREDEVYVNLYDTEED